MMKASATFLILLLAASASAQEAPKPDYSKEAIQEFVMSIDVEEESPVTYFPDSIRFNALGTSWNFHPFPTLMMPLAGTQMGVTQQWPDAFSLTGTQIAMTPRTWYTRRELKRELDRINKRLKAKVDVRTK